VSEPLEEVIVKEALAGVVRSIPCVPPTVLYVTNTHEFVAHAVVDTVFEPATRVAVPTDWEERANLPPVTVPDVLIGCVVDHADWPADATEYCAITWRRFVRSDAEDISITV